MREFSILCRKNVCWCGGRVRAGSRSARRWVFPFRQNHSRARTRARNSARAQRRTPSRQGRRRRKDLAWRASGFERGNYAETHRQITREETMGLFDGLLGGIVGAEMATVVN